ncbi:hypothetical protein Pint_17801 [Pistacia integerrima]|uniref:Uncharacterized protein n=1 Tax=Pistacia integerrima TaxID=434235 RepID=A0ACC0YYW2_9ROSI|nr:hypothetical protein Pint_17801 [Pistacia integerrima]
MSLTLCGSASASTLMAFHESELMGKAINFMLKQLLGRDTILCRFVACVDYPRPDIDNTANFLEAAYLSSSFRASPRPTKPLKVVIAGAGGVLTEAYV